MIEKFQQLPLTHRATIPEDYLDEMGHMNIQYYVHLYDRAAWGMFGLFGVTFEHIKETQLGMFALKQFIQYMTEVHVGQTVAIYSRILGVSAKRLHSYVKQHSALDWEAPLCGVLAP